MKIYLCILISKKNSRFLLSLLNSLDNLILSNNIKLNLVFIVDNKISQKVNIIKKKINKHKYLILFSKKQNIPFSRNIFIRYLKKQNFNYAGFLDDDCTINNKWLINMIKFVKKENCEIAGGPQLHAIKNYFFKDYFYYLEPQRKHASNTSWIATNNCFFSSKIFKDKDVIFDENLSKYGGSDQLFFQKLSKKNFKIKWNLNSYVIENYHPNREKISWFIKRNIRYGYSGNQIDKKLNGKFGLLIIFTKIIYLILLALVSLFFPFKKNYINLQFYFAKAFGRVIGLLNYKPKKYI